MTELDTLTVLKELDEPSKDEVWARWPDQIPGPPGPWTLTQQHQIGHLVDTVIGFDRADPRLLARATDRVAALANTLGLPDWDQLAAVINYTRADTETLDGLELVLRTLGRIERCELIVEGPPQVDGWQVVELGDSTTVAHARAVTDMSRNTGDWSVVVTVQHPAGHQWVGHPITIVGTAAHTIANHVNRAAETGQVKR